MPVIAEFDSQMIATGQTREIPDGAGALIGWTRAPLPDIPTGQFAQFTQGEFVIVDERPPTIPEPVPTKVTMRQARLALLQQDLLAQVQPAIDGLSEAERQAAQIEWDYSQAVERHNSFVNTLAAAMGLSETQLDDLFIYAETL